MRSRGGGGDVTSETALAAALPARRRPDIDGVFSILVAGIGGNGVVTVAAILGMAAHVDQRHCTVLDISGLAQRNGAVMSHLRFSSVGAFDHAARIPQGQADLVLGCDLVVAGGPEGLMKMAPGRTAVVYNQFIAPTSAFALNPDLDFSNDALTLGIAARADAGKMFGVDATRVATAMLGNAIGANLFLVGYAWQKGLIPLEAGSIETAIELNATLSSLNTRAFALGRLAASDPAWTQKWLGETGRQANPESEGLEALVANRVSLLRDYQNAAYAERYEAFVAKVAAAERRIPGQDESLSRTVARVLAKLMAYKDEYEVARLFVGDAFRKQLADTFEGDFKLQFNLAPPLLARLDKRTGRPRKMRFGSWMVGGFRVLAGMRGLRGTYFDIFGYSAHRRLERTLIGEYERLIDALIGRLEAGNYPAIVAIAESFDRIRGYGVVKEQSVQVVRREAAAMIDALRPAPAAAADANADLHPAMS